MAENSTPYWLTYGEAKQLARDIADLKRDMAALKKSPGSQGQGGEHYRHRHFRVVSTHDDYLTCRLHLSASDETLSDDIAVAKPWHMRQSVFDGNTITYDDGSSYSYSYTSASARTVTDTSDSTTQDQVLVPDYIPGVSAGEIIIAVSGNTGLTDSNGDPITWTELNNAPRGWIEDPGA